MNELLLFARKEVDGWVGGWVGRTFALTEALLGQGDTIEDTPVVHGKREEEETGQEEAFGGISPGIHHLHTQHRCPDLTEPVGDELVGLVLRSLEPQNEGRVHPAHGLEATVT